MADQTSNVPAPAGRDVRHAALDQGEYRPTHRAEQVIAAGRLLLAAFLALAIAVAPIDAPRYVAILRPLSFVYLAYATVAAAVVWGRHPMPRYLPVATHVVDLALFSALLHFSAAPTSPFFVYLIFAMVCGAVRWHGRGALLTGAASLAAYLTLTAAGRLSVLPDEFEITRFITRCAQLAVITGLLAYLGSYQRRLQQEIASLAAWPRRLPPEERAAVRDVLGNAAAILRVPRVVLAWHEGDEPSLRVAVGEGDRVEVSRERPDALGGLVAEPLRYSSFFANDAAPGASVTVYRVPGGFEAFRGQPIDQAFLDRFRVRSVLALRIVGDTIDGRLFALDRGGLAIDDILLGDIVGRLVAGALEQQALIAQLRTTAISEERLRLARELHDGVLQSLTAVGLQIGRLIASDEHSAETRARLAQLDAAIAGEHRALREMLDELQPGRPRADRRVNTVNRLREVLTRLERQWDVRVRSELSRDLPALSAPLAHEIARMTEESVVNAVRHGGAREIYVSLEPADGQRLLLIVSYAGRGFAAFEGRHDLDSLRAIGAGPRSLMERVSALGGELRIESGPGGAKVEIGVSAKEPAEV